MRAWRRRSSWSRSKAIPIATGKERKRHGLMALQTPVPAVSRGEGDGRKDLIDRRVMLLEPRAPKDHVTLHRRDDEFMDFVMRAHGDVDGDEVSEVRSHQSVVNPARILEYRQRLKRKVMSMNEIGVNEIQFRTRVHHSRERNCGWRRYRGRDRKKDESLDVDLLHRTRICRPSLSAYSASSAAGAC